MKIDIDTTIEELYSLGKISIRTLHSLSAAGMKTLGQVMNQIDKPIDLLNIRNFGRKSYSEMTSIILNLTSDLEGVATQTNEDKFAALGKEIVDIISDAYMKVIDGDYRIQKYIHATYPTPCDLHYFVMGELDGMLNIVNGFSFDENLEIRRSYKNFLDIVVSRMEENKKADGRIYREYKRKSVELAMKMERFSYEQISDHFLSTTAKDYLEKFYQEHVISALSVRSKKFANKFIPHFSDIIKYAEEPLASYKKICPGQLMVKTLTEIFNVNQILKQEFDRVRKLTDDEILTESLKSKYPFLFSLQRQFVYNFIKKNDYPPLFFLLYHYLRLSEDKSNKIYCMFHGIYDGKKRNLNELAETMNLSRERCRQIVTRKIEVQNSDLANNEAWENYTDLFERSFVYEKTEDYFRIIESEHLIISFDIFAFLLKLIADFDISEVNGHIILINNKFKDLNLSNYFDTLYSIISAKYTTDTYVNIESILTNVPDLLKPDMRILIKYLAEEVYKAKVNEKDQIFLPQNHIDIAEEIYNILAVNGKPMHVEDIFIDFKKRYPNHKFTNPLQIKSYMYKHKHIKPIGKTSCYALDYWEGIYFGSIRNLLIELLDNSDIPLHIDYLYNSVIKHFPNTTKASIASTMEDENLQRFVEFENSFFGLTVKKYPAKYVVSSTTQHYSFEERFQLFKEFVDNYHRFPCYNSSEQESSLSRWYYRVSNGIVAITNDQKKILDDMANYYKSLGYPSSVTENEFLIKSQDIKKYICQNHRLPTNKDAPELYTWLRRSRDNYDSYVDKRREYMTDLLNYILSLGFSI